MITNYHDKKINPAFLYCMHWVQVKHSTIYDSKSQLLATKRWKAQIQKIIAVCRIFNFLFFKMIISDNFLFPNFFNVQSILLLYFFHF